MSTFIRRGSATVTGFQHFTCSRSRCLQITLLRRYAKGSFPKRNPAGPSCVNVYSFIHLVFQSQETEEQEPVVPQASETWRNGGRG
jgi:hypothetical protein